MKTVTNFEAFARGLVLSQKQVDPATLSLAKNWYSTFAGAHAVTMNDLDLVEIYQDLH